MADPAAATLTQLKNIQARTGKTLAELHAAVAASGASKHGERRSWLMQQFKLGYGDANAVVLFMGKPIPDLGAGAPAKAQPPADVDPLAALYSGTKAGLRPLHDLVLSRIRAFGPFEEAPKKTYISLRRKKQFAMIGPATQGSVEIGLNAKDLPIHARLKAQPAGSMCQATTRISAAAEVDALLEGWLRQAFDAAG
jgi:Domain of unknown function (DUF5655)/Domain of unknown function (DUF4287)